MKTRTLVGLTVLNIILVFILWTMLKADAMVEEVQSAPTCQYPERWTNPPNGCDNSDPAVPECIKEMYSQQAEKDCIDRFVSTNNPTPVVTVPEPPQSQISNDKECGK